MKTFNGNVDIYVAGAGTGKTHILLDVIKGFVQQGIPLERIAFVTFTKKAATEAQERMSALFGVPLSRIPYFRTIHSMAFRGVHASKEQMMDQDKYADFGNKAGYNLKYLNMKVIDGVNWNDLKDHTLLLQEQLYRNNKKMFYENVDEVDGLQDFMSLYKQYRKTFNYYDFTDLLELYLKNERVEDVDAVCLDEMQDSTPLQWQVCMQAFSNAKHIVIAGDPRQAIYSFTGADSSILENIRGVQHRLDVSYRVPSNIMNLANEVSSYIINTKVRWPVESQKEGGKIEYIRDMDDITIEPGKSYYLLCRNNKFRSVYTEWCKENGYNYIFNGVPAVSRARFLEYDEGRTTDWPEEYLYYVGRIKEREPRITISTIHGVKGGEADVVILMSDISVLTEKCMEDDEDNEHKVFYVGITRARERLYIMEPTTTHYYPYII